MKIKLNDNQLKILQDSLTATGDSYLLKYLDNINQQDNFIILEESVASKMRDSVGERLQVIGFDKNYKLTDKGKILEELIDILYA